jgi:hypothetical protein
MNKLLELVKAFECECEKHKQVVGGVFLCTYAKIKTPLEFLPFGDKKQIECNSYKD